jgi:hypothetical protein
VETTANQITLDFALQKRRLGKSTIAQNVGITGRITITASISKFNGLKVIYQLLAIRLDSGLNCFQPDNRLWTSNFFIQRGFINFRARRRKSEIGINRTEECFS